MSETAAKSRTMLTEKNPEETQASVALEEDVYTGFVRVEGQRIQVDFSAPPGASQLELDAAFFVALTMATDVDYLKIGTRPLP